MAISTTDSGVEESENGISQIGRTPLYAGATEPLAGGCSASGLPAVHAHAEFCPLAGDIGWASEWFAGGVNELDPEQLEPPPTSAGD
jgi:hypothetical protein